MPPFRLPGEAAPVCPMCDGPCRHEFERSEYRVPDRIPRWSEDPSRADDPPPKEPKPNRRGKRAQKPSEDRMRRPVEDRSA